MQSSIYYSYPAQTRDMFWYVVIALIRHQSNSNGNIRKHPSKYPIQIRVPILSEICTLARVFSRIF